jgi:predicted glycogen debranching enzyme
MIALPGLTLNTHRPEVAASILRTYAQFVDQGMIPNRFPDAGEKPEYNTVDATLWYFEAVRATYEATGDRELLQELYPVLAEIILWHRRGTRYNIYMDEADGLHLRRRRRHPTHLDGRQSRQLGRHRPHRQTGGDQRPVVQRPAAPWPPSPAPSAMTPAEYGS